MYKIMIVVILSLMLFSCGDNTKITISKEEYAKLNQKQLELQTELNKKEEELKFLRKPETNQFEEVEKLKAQHRQQIEQIDFDYRATIRRIEDMNSSNYKAMELKYKQQIADLSMKLNNAEDATTISELAPLQDYIKNSRKVEQKLREDLDQLRTEHNTLIRDFKNEVRSLKDALDHKKDKKFGDI